MTSPFNPISRREKDSYLKEPLEQKTIHAERSLTDDSSHTVKLVAVGGGYRKKQGLVLSPSTAN